MKKQEYGIADRAWQPLVGCDPHMECAPRCWARKTVARIVECQKTDHPERAEFYQIALTPDGKRWSGKTYLDERHLTDPLKWRNQAIIATGFHGDWGRLADEDKDRVMAVAALCPQHVLMMLTKCPEAISEYLRPAIRGAKTRIYNRAYGLSAIHQRALGVEFPFPSVTLGVSVMHQVDADKYRPAMAALAAMGWRTHVWYEPAIGAVNWDGWDFVRLIISGGESGTKARPSDPQWHRDTRDFCRRNGIAYRFKQWGEWAPDESLSRELSQHRFLSGEIVYRVGKKAAGDLLDGMLHDELPPEMDVSRRARMGGKA